MQIKSKILSILRVINVIMIELQDPKWTPPKDPLSYYLTSDEEEYKYKRAKEQDYLVQLLEKNGIDKTDYPVLKDILQSMALMTMASVATIRDPSGYDFDQAKPWGDYFPNYRQHFSKFLTTIGVKLRQVPTQHDYELAQKMIKVLGKSIVDEKEVRAMFFNSGIEKEFGMNKTAASRRYLHGSKTLYRGLHSLSRRAYQLATTVGEEWDIERGVSTSMIYEIAENFATENAGHGYNLIFIINNPKKQGFVADRLSGYDEKEVILSGRLKVTKVAPPSSATYYRTHVYVDLL